MKKIISYLLVLSVVVPSFASGQMDTHKKDYYAEGQAAAKGDFKSKALAGGLIMGAVGGVIGWGAGYLIISLRQIKVPAHHVADLDPKQKTAFENGYKKTIKKMRNRRFHLGAAVGNYIQFLIIDAMPDETFFHVT